MPPGRKPKNANQFLDDARRLAEVVRTARENLPISQEALMARPGLGSVSWLSKLERGEITEPGFFPVLALLRELGLGTDVQGLFVVTQEAPRSG